MKSLVAGAIAAILSLFGALHPATGTANTPHSQAAAAAFTQELATTSDATSTDSTAVGSRTATTTIVNNYITQPVVERIVATTTSGVSETELDTKLNQLENKLTSLIYNWTGTQGGSPASPVTNSIGAGGVWNAIAGTNKIDNLSGVTISNSTIDTVSIPDLSGSYLSLKGGTVSGDLTVTGTFSGGTLNLTNASTSRLSIFGNAYFGGTATSSFDSAGALTLATPLRVGSGGTGWNSFASGYLLFGNGSTALATSSNLFWDTSHNYLGIGTTSPAYALDVNGTIQSSDLISKGPLLDVRAFGAKGNGVTDDTVAIQSAINFAVLHNRTLYVPATNGNYEISSSLSISGSLGSGFGIVGDGTIEQTTDNTPILVFSGDQKQMRISGLTLRYRTSQASSNTSAICIELGGNSPFYSTYNSEFSNLRFNGCAYGIKQDAHNAFWGNRLTNLHFQPISVSAIDLSYFSEGSQPNNYFGNIYVYASSNTDTIFKLSYMNELTLDNVEINAIANTGAFTFTNDRNVYVRNARIEGGTFGLNYNGLTTISGVEGFQLSGYEVQSVSFNPTNYNFIFRDASPSVKTIPFSVDGINLQTVTGNNKLYLFASVANYGRVQTPVQGGNTGILGNTYPYDSSSKLILVSSTLLSPWFQNGNADLYSLSKVGIGTSSPYALLSVSNSANTAANTPLFVIASTTGGTATTTVLSVAATGNVTITGSAATCTLGNGSSATNCSSSDQRLKDDITSLDASSSLAAVRQLNPVSFKWNAWMVGNGSPTTTQLGFIAQQVAPVFGNLVSEDPNTHYYKLDYQGLFAPIVGAIQALANEISGFADSFTTKELTFTRATGDEIDVHRAVADELCARKSDGTPVCVTGDQLAATLGGTASASSEGGPGASAPTSPPVIQINGSNPAIIQLGTTYSDLGATITGPEADLNLGIKTFLNGAFVSNIVVDTSAAATDTIDYVVTDQNGLTSTSTRTVIIQAPQSDAAMVVTDATTSAATSTSQ